jgi:hypothetical protein
MKLVFTQLQETLNLGVINKGLIFQILGKQLHGKVPFTPYMWFYITVNTKNIIFIRMQLASSAGISPEESGGGKKFVEVPAINRHKNLHCA